jgi:hypothetical protein
MAIISKIKSFSIKRNGNQQTAVIILCVGDENMMALKEVPWFQNKERAACGGTHRTSQHLGE